MLTIIEAFPHVSTPLLDIRKCRKVLGAIFLAGLFPSETRASKTYHRSRFNFRIEPPEGPWLCMNRSQSYGVADAFDYTAVYARSSRSDLCPAKPLVWSKKEGMFPRDV